MYQGRTYQLVFRCIGGSACIYVCVFQCCWSLCCTFFWVL